MEKCYQRNKDKAQFIGVYIREAHPSDGWQVPKNETDGVVYKQPKTEEERHSVASTCAAKLELTFPFVVDGMDNRTEAAYAGWPDRLYIVAKDGTIAYKGRPGPGGFSVAEMQARLEELLKAR